MQRAPGMETMDASPQWWINMWSHWDAGWHVSVAQRGYQIQSDAPSNVAFFPLFPLLIKALTLLRGRSDEESFLVSGILVANGALLIALGCLAALVRLDADESIARRAVWYLLLFPASLFLSAVYADSLFLALVLASFLSARRGHWWAAGLLGCEAALVTNPSGLVWVQGMGRAAPGISPTLPCQRLRLVASTGRASADRSAWPAATVSRPFRSIGRSTTW